jgi:adenine-specific DNA-methyltransferase
MTENYKRLIKLLKELFQIDRPDLDFGIYRIMNQKRDEIISFLDKDLLPQVKKAFAAYGSGGRGDIQAELDKMVANLKDAGIDPNSSPKVKELKGKLNASVDVTELENEVYSYLYNFFRRYYKDGDFLSLRRYKKDVYAIPYEGEEVKLHWANADQYYIKSSENFRDYTFKLGELPGEGEEDKRKIVHFKLIEADTELANNKAQEGKKRRFVLCSDSPMIEDDGELFIRFEYKPLAKKQAQKKLNESAVKTLLDNPEYVDWIRELAREENGTSILEKHVNSYTAKNSFDYFIHKDLGGFLRRELDFFIKNEVMHLDDIEEETVPRVEQYLSQINRLPPNFKPLTDKNKVVSASLCCVV